MIKCLLIDDEPLAHEVIINYLEKLNHFELVGNCYSAVEAINFLHKNKVDVLFLDINMPEMNGLEMISSLQNPPKVILTTAYSEFALDAFEYNVVDYLLKPIRFPRFLKSINKLEAILEKVVDHKSESAPNYLEIKENFMPRKIPYDEILYLQAFGNFVNIFTLQKKYIIGGTLKNYEETLSPQNFIRVHKSYLINRSHIQDVKTDSLQINQEKIPIGNSYKNFFRKKLSED